LKHPLATSAELAKVDHKFVFIIIKRSYSPENAIYEFDIQMADEVEDQKNSKKGP
jgi:hypothetical protein